MFAKIGGEGGFILDVYRCKENVFLPILRQYYLMDMLIFLRASKMIQK